MAVPVPGQDHVAGGIALRNQAGGEIALTGAPPGAQLVSAYLYWGVIGTEPPGVASNLYHKVMLNGFLVQGTLIGATLQPCWLGEGYFYSFRALVTNRLAPAINGRYDIDPLLPAASVKDGRGSWHDEPAALVPPLAAGASLVAIFSHPSLPSAARVYLHDGAQLITGAATFSHALSPPLPASTVLRHTRIGADGQNQVFGSPTLPITTALGRVLPSLENWQAIRGPGSPVDAAPDWQGSDGPSSTRLWDTQTTVLTRGRTDLLAGDTSYEVGYVSVLPYPPFEPMLPDDPNPFQGPLEDLEALALATRGYPGINGDPPEGIYNFDCVVVVAHVLSAQ
jgi:hypothetical protein